MSHVPLNPLTLLHDVHFRVPLSPYNLYEEECYGQVLMLPVMTFGRGASYLCVLSVLQILIHTWENAKLQTWMSCITWIFVTYHGNFCTGVIRRLSRVNLRLCSRAFACKNRANWGRCEQAVRIAFFAFGELFINDV